MKIHFLERDGRKNDLDFKQTMGSFSVICSILEKGLRELGVYTDDINEATHVGIADALATDFNIPNKRCFGIFFVDCANTIPTIALQRLYQNKNLKMFSINKHTSDLYKEHGFECNVVGPGLDSDFWVPNSVKYPIFTFLHTGFSNIRSGLDILIQAYDLAFRHIPNVRLIIKNTSESVVLASKIAHYKQSNNIIYLQGRMTATQIKELYQQSQVLCSVFRHSGHGLPIGEASACNCLPLVGDFAPSNEIVDPSFGVLLKPSRLVKMNEIKSSLVNEWGLTDTFGGLQFPEEPLVCDYDIKEYAKTLRDIYENYHNYTNIRENCLKKWDYLQSAKNLLKYLEN